MLLTLLHLDSPSPHLDFLVLRFGGTSHSPLPLVCTPVKRKFLVSTERETCLREVVVSELGVDTRGGLYACDEGRRGCDRTREGHIYEGHTIRLGPFDYDDTTRSLTSPVWNFRPFSTKIGSRALAIYPDLKVFLLSI